jgi:hypothetical protein
MINIIFKPKEDITTFELALIFKLYTETIKCSVDQGREIINKLSENIKRHLSIQEDN